MKIIGLVVFIAVFIGMMSLMGSPSSFETGLSLVVAAIAGIYVVYSFGNKK